MRVKVCGVKRVEGVGKESGSPFDMCRVLILVPVENVTQGKTKITGFGSELAEMELAQEAMPQFSGLSFPAEVELHTEQRMFRGKFETYCAGIVPGVQGVKSVRPA